MTARCLLAIALAMLLASPVAAKPGDGLIQAKAAPADGADAPEAVAAADTALQPVMASG